MLVEFNDCRQLSSNGMLFEDPWQAYPNSPSGCSKGAALGVRTPDRHRIGLACLDILNGRDHRKTVVRFAGRLREPIPGQIRDHRGFWPGEGRLPVGVWGDSECCGQHGPGGRDYEL